VQYFERETFKSLPISTFKNLSFCLFYRIKYIFTLKNIYKLLQKSHSIRNPFTINLPGFKTALWIKPSIVCEVEFTEWTTEGILRHPSFKGLRMDKKATEIIKGFSSSKNTENIKSQTPYKKFNKPAVTASDTKLTHPNKILYAEDKITKLELANYTQSVSFLG
jgi:bifunctional non-homologous end joining protein LigD